MEFEKMMREKFPCSHPGYVDLTLKELKLCVAKGHDFNKGGNSLGSFYRVSAIKKLYPGFDWDSPFGTAIDYKLKQFDAMMHMRAQKTEAKVETIPVRLMDMIVYDKLAILLYEDEREVSDGKRRA